MVSAARAKITLPPAKPTKPAKPTPQAKAAPPPKIEITVETGDFAAALNAVAQQVNAALQGIATAMAAQDARLTAVAEQQQKLLKAIADRPPIVQMAERPRSFLVDIENADGSSRKMRVSAEYQGH